MGYRIATDSPLRSPPMPLSERQIMLLDGIRHAANMAGISLDRLWEKLTEIDSSEGKFDTSDLSEAALYAWSIVDAAHRIADLISNLPGLSNSSWRRIFTARMRIAMELRNEWQHQLSDVDRVVTKRGQMWGALAWHQHQGGGPTGQWFLAVIGSDLMGSRWNFAGPVNKVERVDARRIRLLHCNRDVYLCRIVRDLFEAIAALEEDIGSGKLALRGQVVNQARSSDWVIASNIVVVTRPSPAPPPPEKGAV